MSDDLKGRNQIEELTIDTSNVKKMVFDENVDKKKRAAELVIANKELAFQNMEKEKRAAESSIDNIRLVKQSMMIEALNDQLEDRVLGRTAQKRSHLDKIPQSIMLNTGVNMPYEGKYYKLVSDMVFNAHTHPKSPVRKAIKS